MNKKGTIYSSTGRTFMNAQVSGWEEEIIVDNVRVLLVAQQNIKGILTFYYISDRFKRHWCFEDQNMWLTVEGE